MVLEINLIVRELLAKHNYISLPGLGSFIQKYEPARPTADGKGFISPKQSITFDSSRTFNDEAIENYLYEKLGISHSDAFKLLDEFINKIKDDLKNGKDFVFENVGTLSKNKKGEIRFEQAHDLDVALSTFGLKDVEVTKTAKSKGEPQPFASKPQVKSAKKASSTRIVFGISSVIVIAALVIIFTLNPELRFWERYINTHNALTESRRDTVRKVESRLSQVNNLPDSSVLNKDSLNTKVDQTITDNNIKKTALYYEEPKTQDSKTFYLIVGSFGRLENAQKLAEKYNQKGFTAEIIQGNAMYRVSINKFIDKNRALSEFKKFRANYPNESVWLLGI